MAYRLSLAIVGSCWAIFAANLLSSYPDGWDAVHYHLPVAVRWLQQRSLAMPPSHPWKYSLPGNAEIGMMLWLGTGWQATASLFNTLAAVLTIAATYTLANRFSGDRGGASLATLVGLDPGDPVPGLPPLCRPFRGEFPAGGRGAVPSVATILRNV